MRMSLIEEAIQYIEYRLKQPLHASEVAKSVHLSYYHFHRVFQVMTGETPGNYIRKRRLTEAALELLSSRRPILDIAVEYQFESQEAFGRAFKKLFGISPSKFRSRSIRPISTGKAALVDDRLGHRCNNISLEPDIVTLNEDISVMGIYGNTNISGIADLWKECMQQFSDWNERQAGARAYGICVYVNDVAIGEVSEHTELTEFVGFEESALKGIPDGVNRYRIRAGTYAVFRHQGPVSMLRYTYEYIWGTWLANTSWSLDERDDFEEYGPEFQGPDHEESIIYIYMPITTLQGQV